MTDPNDHLRRFQAATKAEKELRKEMAANADERAGAMADMHRLGFSYGQIARQSGISRGRVQQLVERANRDKTNT